MRALRAIDPQLLDTVDAPEVNVLLPAVLADFAQRDVNLALDFRAMVKRIMETTPIVAVAQPNG